MAETLESTVKQSSDGMVKITVEKYNELLAKSAEKAPIIHRTTHVHRTPEIVASDNKMRGGCMMGVGVAFVVVGGIRFFIGYRQAGKL